MLAGLSAFERQNPLKNASNYSYSYSVSFHTYSPNADLHARCYDLCRTVLTIMLTISKFVRQARILKLRVKATLDFGLFQRGPRSLHE